MTPQQYTDCKTAEDRLAFMSSPAAWQTGAISPAVQHDAVAAFEALVKLAKIRAALDRCNEAVKIATTAAYIDANRQLRIEIEQIVEV